MNRQENDLISRQAAIRFIRDKVSLSLFMKRSVDKADKACMELCDMLDRELPSAQQRWIPFTKRDLTVEEREEHPEWCYIMECPLPDDGQEILVSNDRFVWVDTFYVDDGCYLDSDSEFEGCAWMPLPDPWKGEEE